MLGYLYGRVGAPEIQNGTCDNSFYICQSILWNGLPRLYSDECCREGTVKSRKRSWSSAVTRRSWRVANGHSFRQPVVDRPPLATCGAVPSGVVAGRWPECGSEPFGSDQPIAPNSPRKRCACSGDLNRRMARSRCRVGWCEFSARLLSPLCRRCSVLGRTRRRAGG